MIYTTDGKGHLIKAHLESISPKECVAAIEEIEKKTPLPYNLHMAVAPTKNNDRFEWFLEKATEIGVHSITPVFCDHSERRVIKPERFEKIIESAMKQSLKAFKPKLNEAVSFTEFVGGEFKDDLRFIAHCEDAPKKLLQDLIRPEETILIAIGPEGDFSTKEIDLARRNGFVDVSLGNHRLRTETAAIVACTTVALLNN